MDDTSDTTQCGGADLPGVNRRRVALGAAVLGLAGALPRARSGARAEVATPAASPAPGGDPVLLGCPYNLSGAYASIGAPARDGSLLAAAQVNRDGGVLGRPLRLRVADVEGDPAEAAAATRRLIEDDRVAAVVGLTDTTFVLAAAPVAQAAGVPFLDVGATAPAIAAVGDYVFMLPFGDNVQAAVAAEYCAAEGFRRVAILRNRDTAFTRLLAGYFAARLVAPDLGGEIVADEGYAADGADVAARLDALAVLDPAPEALFFAAGPEESGTVVKQARDRGLPQPIVGGDGYDTPRLVGDGGAAAEGVVFTTHAGIYGDSSPLAAAFLSEFAAAYGEPPPSVFAALGYDAVLLMADAIGRAGSLDPIAVRDALAATGGFRGVTGAVAYAPGERVPVKAVALVRVENGRFVLLREGAPRHIPPP